MVHLFSWCISVVRSLDRLVGKWLGIKWMSKVVEVECYLVRIATDHYIVSAFPQEDQHEDSNIQLLRKFAHLEGSKGREGIEPNPLHIFSMPEWYALDVGLEYL